ncbi:MAG TPA: ice-binding family protein, partial [Flavipsychrobacter sp.]|nr:ice-binding family protein [Flavipsychrobacter sp.]
MSKKLLKIFFILLLPLVGKSQVITLGAAADFVLFTSDGAIGNVPTSTSHLTGDVGTNNGGVTGFGNVNGTMHNANGATAAAKASLLLAAGQINTTVSTFFPAPNIGNGDTLDAGVYSIAGITTLSGNLILNGNNDSNAVFIFKMSAAFSSTTLSEVVLINGAKACNVFWKSSGAINLASGTKMKGNVIADVGAIDLAANVEVEGRILSTTGAITLNAVTAYTPTGCGSALLTGPLAPPLGATACYGLFSGNGSVTSGSLTTVVIGDVGTNLGLTTGFDPLNVTGTVHPNPDMSTAATAADLLVVYNFLNTLPHDIELLYPAQFGNKLVLTPHTYLLGAATTLNDTLFLNAENNPNAVFVIKINGALSTGTYANVKLINGAQAKNVFWKIDGAASINDYSQFKGTIVVNQGAININTGVVLEGRAMTTSGALGTAAVTVNMTPGCNAVLPLQPFPCGSDKFVSMGANTNAGTTLYRLLSNGSYQAIGDSLHGIAYDGIGFNPIDRFIYSIKYGTDTLIRIGNDGRVEKIGQVTGIAGGPNWSAGVILPTTGELVVRANNTNTPIYKINLTTRVATSMA